MGNIGSISLKQGKYTEALEKFEAALALTRNSELSGESGSDYAGLAETYLAISAVPISEESSLPVGLNKSKALQLLLIYSDSAVAFFEAVEDLQALSEALDVLSKAQAMSGKYSEAYSNQVRFKQLNDSVFNIKKDKKITQTFMQYDFEKKEAAAQSEQEKKYLRQRNIRNSIAAGLAEALIFLVVVYKQRNRISKEKKRSEELLLNILPEEVAEELKAKRSAEAK